MFVLFWDIDGTLLTTGGAGLFAWAQALEEVAGARRPITVADTAGLTDVEIASNLLKSAGVAPDPALQARLLARYEDLLPASLPRKEGRVMPGVRDLLAAGREAGAVHLLLTGNTRRGARAKLAHYGLSEHFSEGGFSTDAPDRPSIARCAWRVASDLRPGLQPDRALVIGDTPHDVTCARAIGVRCLAVGTGVYSAEQLRAHGPWWAVESLPAAGSLFERLGLPA
jgi:phosphoglycolate phosphatase